MRTSTAAWAAALAVMSMHGPFTTAEAAPARHADPARPRPQFHKVLRRQGFNDTQPTVKTRDPDPLVVPSIPPIIGSTPSDTPPPPDPSPAPPPPPPKPPKAKAPKPTRKSIVGSLLGGLSQAESSSLPLTSSVSVPASSSSDSTDSDSLLGSIGGTLTQAIPPTPTPLSPLLGTGKSKATPAIAQGTAPKSDGSGLLPTPSGVIPDPLSVLGSGNRSGKQQSTKTGNGILPDVSVFPTGLGGVTSKITSGISGVGTALTKLTGTGGVVSTLTSEATQIIPSGISGVGTGLTGTGGVLPKATEVPAILSSVQSEVTAAVSSAATATSALPTHPIAHLRASLDSKLSNIAATATDPAVVSSLQSGFSSILTSAASNLANATATVDSVISSAASTVQSVAANPTSTLDSIVSAATSTLDSIVSDATSTLDSVVSTPAATITSVLGNPTSTVDSIVSGPASGVGSVVSSVIGTIGSVVSTTPTFTLTAGPTTVVVPIPTGPTTGVSPTTTSDVTTSDVTTSDATTSDTGPTSVAPASTDSTQPSPTSNSTDSTVAVSTGETVTSTPASSSPSSTTPALITTTDTTKDPQPQVSIVPTGTDTRTTLPIPTVWSFAPSSTKTKGQVGGPARIATATGITLSSSSAIPTYMPQIVQPAGGLPTPPDNATLIQVGFTFSLNYPFVISKPESASQIFAYLPQGIAYGLGISREQITMNALMPYDTSQKLGYITTLAQAYIPADLVTQLQLNLHTSASPIYYNPDTPVKSLMDTINPTIPILPGAAMEGNTDSSTYYSPEVAAAAGMGDGAPLGGSSGGTKKVKGSTVGIGLGAVAGAAVYAAAMIYVARRYRQKRKGHQRASSVATAGQMTQRSSGGMGAFFMSGANGRGSARNSAANSGGRASRTSNGSSNGRSVREQGISAPLMSENSLGWGTD